MGRDARERGDGFGAAASIMYCVGFSEIGCPKAAVSSCLKFHSLVMDAPFFLGEGTATIPIPSIVDKKRLFLTRSVPVPVPDKLGVHRDVEEAKTRPALVLRKTRTFDREESGTGTGC